MSLPLEDVTVLDLSHALAGPFCSTMLADFGARVIKLEPKGGGGTDMRVPLKYAEQFDPKVVVLFTDGYTPWPKEEPPYPLIVCCTTNVEVPVGQVIRI